MFKSFLVGVKSYLDSFKLLNELKLWKYFTIPILASIVTAFLCITIAYFSSDYLSLLIDKVWIWEWGKETFHKFSWFLSFLIIVSIFVLIYKHIVMAIAAPFMSPVSEKIEAHLIGEQHEHVDSTFTQQLIRGTKINARNLVKELGFTIPLLLLGFIPFLSPFCTILVLLIQSYYAGFGNMDYTLERHYDYKRSIKFVRKNRFYAVGNGLVFNLILMIPFIGFILVLPLSVTAASKMTVERLNETHLISDNS